jgi:hypothetical protein
VLVSERFTASVVQVAGACPDGVGQPAMTPCSFILFIFAFIFAIKTSLPVHRLVFISITNTNIEMESNQSSLLDHHLG